MNSSEEAMLPPPYETMVSRMEIELIEDLLRNECTLYPQ